MKRDRYRGTTEAPSTAPRGTEGRRDTSRSSSESDPVAHLHRRIGNQAVQELYTRAQSQASLAVSDPAGPTEREAERVAAEVMRAESPSVASESGRPTKRGSATARATGGFLSGEAERQIRSSLNGGRPLPERSRLKFQARFGYDFSDVRIHSGHGADEAARSINAEAFTLGSDIAFRRDAFDVESSTGRRLLAHELAHVVQHHRGPGVAHTAQESAASRPVTTLQHAHPRTVFLQRDPDVVHEGYHTFYLTQGRSREIAVQFHRPGADRGVSVKVAHAPSGTMREGTVQLSAGASLEPTIRREGETITRFDLDGDGEDDVAVQVTVDDYHEEFLTEDTTPTSPSVESYTLRDVYVIATWAGGSLALQHGAEIPEEAIAPPIWRRQRHPHPDIGMAYFNARSGRYVIPPIRMPSLSSTAEGPPPFLDQERIALPERPAGVSKELWAEPHVPWPESELPSEEPSPREYVRGWLEFHKNEIQEVEREYGVDRRAISGAIAWEALHNVWRTTALGIARWRGPGKVHLKEDYFSEGDPISADVERLGYVPWDQQSVSKRAERLGEVSDSITYIAAIMNLLLDEGKKEGVDLTCDPALLTTFYQRFGLEKARERFREKTKEELGPSSMGIWVGNNLDYLEEAVGQTTIECPN